MGNFDLLASLNGIERVNCGDWMTQECGHECPVMVIGHYLYLSTQSRPNSVCPDKNCVMVTNYWSTYMANLTWMLDEFQAAVVNVQFVLLNNLDDSETTFR